MKGIGVAVRGFLFENAFWLRNFRFEIGLRVFDSQAGQERGAPSCLLQDAAQTSGCVGKVKCWIWFCCIPKFQFRFHQNISPVCLALPRMEADTGVFSLSCFYVMYYKSQHASLIKLLLSVLFSVCTILAMFWPTAMFVAIRVFRIGCGFMWRCSKPTWADVLYCCVVIAV